MTHTDESSSHVCFWIIKWWDYFTIHDGSFFSASFSGPRMATPRVLWPTARYLRETRTLVLNSLSGHAHDYELFLKWREDFTFQLLPPGFCERRRKVSLCDSASSRLWLRSGSDPFLHDSFMITKLMSFNILLKLFSDMFKLFNQHLKI